MSEVPLDLTALVPALRETCGPDQKSRWLHTELDSRVAHGIKCDGCTRDQTRRFHTDLDSTVLHGIELPTVSHGIGLDNCTRAVGLVRTRNLDGSGIPARVQSGCETLAGPRAVAKPRPKLRSNPISKAWIQPYLLGLVLELGTFFCAFLVECRFRLPCFRHYQLTDVVASFRPALFPPPSPSFRAWREHLKRISRFSPDAKARIGP